MMADSVSKPQGQEPLLRLHLIGQMQAWSASGASILPPGRKTRALLAVTALVAPRPALRGRLAELLWSRRPEEHARASLRQEVHRLTEAFGPDSEQILQVTRDHVALRPGTFWIDVEAVMNANSQNPEPLSLLHGDLLEDLNGLDPGFDLWLMSERERLRDRGRFLAERLLEEQRRPDEAIIAAQRVLSIDRAHEGAWRTLMRAHAARGERGMAIEAYDRCRAALAEMLDAVPSPETQRLLADIRSGLAMPMPRQASEPQAALATGPKPSGSARLGTHIGVLPFSLVGSGLPDGDLGQGLAEEIAGCLSRVRRLHVVPPTSLARFAEPPRDDQSIMRIFGLDLLLEGTVHQSRNRLRVSARLLDLHRGGRIAWVGRFDRAATDAFAVQHEVAAELTAQVDPAIWMTVSQRLAQDPNHETSAYALMLRALPLLSRPEPASLNRAEELLRNAVRKDPDFAPAQAVLAFRFAVATLQSGQPAGDRKEVARLAENAIRLDPFDARVLAMTGYARSSVLHEADEGAALLDRAVELNPTLSMGWALAAAVFAFCGNLEKAAQHAQCYKRLSPADPWAACFDPALPLIALLRGDFAGAADGARAQAQTSPGNHLLFQIWLAALGHLGRKQPARELLTRLQQSDRELRLGDFRKTTPLRRTEDVALFEEGLRLAGVSP